MKFLILGAGGIGCYYGARLIKAGHQVDFVARGAHLAALNDSGLNLSHPDFKFNEPVTAFSLQQIKRCHPDEYVAVLVCVKSTSTVEVAESLREWFSYSDASTMVISLQNGVDNESILVNYVNPSDVAGGLAVRIGGHISEPGMVVATGIAQIILGPWPNETALFSHKSLLCSLISVFNGSDIPTKYSCDIKKELWRKLVINNGVNPLSAITQLDTGAITHDLFLSELVKELMLETAKVAVADNIVLTEGDVLEMFELIQSFDPIKTSMLIDKESGKSLEIDTIPGAVIDRANKLGIKVPHTFTVYSLLRHMS